MPAGQGEHQICTGVAGEGHFCLCAGSSQGQHGQKDPVACRQVHLVFQSLQNPVRTSCCQQGKGALPVWNQMQTTSPCLLSVVHAARCMQLAALCAAQEVVSGPVSCH